MLALGTVGLVGLLMVMRYTALATLAGFLTAFFLVGSSGIWGIILAENLPTQVRAAGVGFLYNVGAIGGGVAPFVVLSSLRVLGLQLSQAIGAFTVVATLLCLLLLCFVRETRGISLLDDESTVTPGV
jgi:SHS family sialic acid transporter-like MFS transporter